jgi:hypothetical protein
MSSNLYQGIVLWGSFHTHCGFNNVTIFFTYITQTEIKADETLSLNNLLVTFRLCCLPENKGVIEEIDFLASRC